MCREVALLIECRTGGESAGRVLALATSAPGPRHPPRATSTSPAAPANAWLATALATARLTASSQPCPSSTSNRPPAPRRRRAARRSSASCAESHGGCDSLHLSSARERSRARLARRKSPSDRRLEQRRSDRRGDVGALPVRCAGEMAGDRQAERGGEQDRIGAPEALQREPLLGGLQAELTCETEQPRARHAREDAPIGGRRDEASPLERPHVAPPGLQDLGAGLDDQRRRIEAPGGRVDQPAIGPLVGAESAGHGPRAQGNRRPL